MRRQAEDSLSYGIHPDQAAVTGHREVNELQCHTAGEGGRVWSVKACGHTHRVNSRKRKGGAMCGGTVHTSGPSNLGYTLAT